jgi:hypothetical protein
MREFVQDALLTLCAIPLVLGLCVLYWLGEVDE